MGVLDSFSRCCAKHIYHRRFTGVEFAIVHSEPPSLFIVQKRERLSPEEGLWYECSYLCPQLILVVRPLSVYFIANNRIYQAPDIYTVLSNRLVRYITPPALVN